MQKHVLRFNVDSASHSRPDRSPPVFSKHSGRTESGTTFPPWPNQVQLQNFGAKCYKFGRCVMLTADYNLLPPNLPPILTEHSARTDGWMVGQGLKIASVINVLIFKQKHTHTHAQLHPPPGETPLSIDWLRCRRALR